MNLQEYAELGLSMNEAKIYDALVTFGASSVSTIALRSKVHRSNTYDSLRRLIEKGLVFEVLGPQETIFEAVDPHKLLEILEEKRTMVERGLPSLLSRFHKHHSPERVYIYKGIEGMKNYLREVVRVGEDVYTIGAKGAWLHPALASFMEWFRRECRKSNVHSHILFDDELRSSGSRPTVLPGEYKFLPAWASSTSSMDIFGDHVVVFAETKGDDWIRDLTVFVMVSPDFAASFRQWWSVLWKSVPGRPGRMR